LSFDPAFGGYSPLSYENFNAILKKLGLDAHILGFEKDIFSFTHDRGHAPILQCRLVETYPDLAAEIERFERDVPIIRADPSYDFVTAEEYFARGAYSTAFIRYYMPGKIVHFFLGHTFRHYLHYPIRLLLSHAASYTSNLDFYNRNPICIVKGGSGHYARRFKTYLVGKGVKFVFNSSVSVYRRGHTDVELLDAFSGQRLTFDHVVFATQPDVAGSLLNAYGLPGEADLLKGFSITTNTIVAHHDASILPANKAHWTHANAICEPPDAPLSLEETFFVTRVFPANDDPQQSVFITYCYDRDLDLKDAVRVTNRHVHVNMDTVRRRLKLDQYQGRDRVWYCGSWLKGLTLQEDAIESGLEIANRISGRHEYPIVVAKTAEERQPDKGEHLEGNFVDVFAFRAKSSPDQVALRYLGEDGQEKSVLTYADLHQRAENLGYYLLTDLKVKKGDIVVLCYMPGVDHIVVLLGCLLAGVVPAVIAPLNPKQISSDLEQFAAIITNCSARYVLTDSTYYKYYLAGRTLSPSTYFKGIAAKWVSTSKLKTTKPRDFRFPKIGVHDVAYVQYTSGSTADPKGVVVEHAQLSAQLDGLKGRLRVSPGGAVVSWVPQFHNIGLVGVVLLSIYGKVENVMLSPFLFLQDPGAYLKALATYKANFTVMPSFGLRYMLEKIPPEDRNVNLSNLQNWSLGGEAVPADLLERFVDGFAASGVTTRMMSPGYGLGENVTIVSLWGKSLAFVDMDELLRKKEVREGSHAVVSCGEPLPDTEIQLVDPETGHIVSENTVGEIWVKSSSMARGYLGNDEATNYTFGATIAGGDPEKHYLRTGDLGFVQNKELFVCGRTKELIIIRGVNVYPVDIETALADFHEVDQSAAFGVLRGDEEVLAVAVELADKAVRRLKRNEAFEDLDARVRLSVQKHCGVNPTIVAFLKSRGLPRTPLGKIKRTACRDAMNDGSLSTLCLKEVEAPSAAMSTALELTSDDGPKEVILRHIKAISRVDVDPTTPIADQLMFESLELVRFVDMLAQTFGMDVPLTVLEQCQTVDDLVAFVEASADYKVLPTGVKLFNSDAVNDTDAEIFLIHPARGNVICYLEFAGAWGKRFYAIKDTGPQDSLEAKARHYIGLIRQVKPTGPYVLGGYSFGATLSQVMAGLLEEEGETVEQVVLFDELHGFPDEMRRFGETGITEQDLLHHIIIDYCAGGQREKLETALKQGRPAAEVIALVSDDDVRVLIEGEFQCYKANAGLLQRWTPIKSYKGPTTLFRTATCINELQNAYSAVFEIPGNHATCMIQPHVSELVAALNESWMSLQVARTGPLLEEV